MLESELKKQLKDQDMWTRTSALIQILLPKLSKASLEEIHIAALKQKLSDIAERSAFCRYYDIAQIMRKKFVVEGKVRIDRGQVYVWLDGPSKASVPTAVEHKSTPKPAKEEKVEAPKEADKPAEPAPAVAASPDTDEEAQDGGAERAALEAMSKSELVELAKEKDIDHKGNKGELIDRLLG